MLKLFKHIIPALFLALLLPAMASAQATHDPARDPRTPAPAIRPAVIEDISKMRMPASHYETQQMLWKQKVLHDMSNADAWLNYYKAVRAIDQAKGIKNISKTKQAELDTIVNAMEKNVPNTFEFHYVKYINGNDHSLFSHLEKAYELQPGRIELYKELILYYAISKNVSKKKEFCKKWYESNDIAPSVYEYNRNVLASLQPGAVLYTNGDYDTYPLWILQEVENIRTDVTVINVNVLEKYKEASKLFANAGITIPAPGSKENKGAYLAGIALLNPHRPFYFALSLSQNYLKPIKDQLYLTGLAFRYSSAPFDNTVELKKNFSENISLAYLDKQSTYDTKYLFNRETVHQLNLNYIMPLMILHETYKTEGRDNKAEEVLALARKLAKQGGKETLLDQYLQKKQ